MAWRLALTAEMRAGLLGLMTNVSCLQAPEGALHEAENVVFRRAGCAEPRDGIKSLASVSGTPVWGLSTASDDYYVKVNAGNFSWTRVSTGLDVQYIDPVLGVVEPQPFRRDCWTRADLRGNTYVPYTAGVLKLATSSFLASGLPPFASSNLIGPSSVATWLANNEKVAYRFVTVRVDDDGLIVRSIPTGSVTVENTGGVAQGVTIELRYDSQFQGLLTSVEVYRTRNFPVANQVDDEMQLVGTVDASLFTLSGGFYSAFFYDTVLPSARGADLYTNPSQGGIAKQNERPPAAAVVAAYKQAVFFGNVRSAQRLKFSYDYTSPAALTGVAGGIGMRTFTGDTAIGVASITSAASIVGVERGMVVDSSQFPDGTYITNISGATLTMSQPASATTVGQSHDAYDSFNVDGTWIAVNDFPANLVTYGDGRFIAYTLTPSQTGKNTTVTLETILRSAGAAVVQATHGDEYVPALPTYTETAREMDQDTLPGVIFWTKTDEPEHVAPGNFAYVGDSAKAILGLAPTRDALYVLKEDGVWRLTGVDGTWQIDPFDPTTYCILPTSVQPLNGRVYFLGNNGVVSFGDEGLTVISQPINDLIKPVIDQVRRNFRANGYYELDSIVGGTSAIFEREDEYLLARGSTSYPLVFNEWTSGWSTWRYYSPSPLASGVLFTFDREGRAVHGIGSEIYGTRLSTDAQSGTLTLEARNDGERAVTASSYSSAGGFVTLSAPVTAMADDVIQDPAGVLWRIVNDVSGSATVYVTCGDTSVTFTTGACVLYRSIRTNLSPRPYVGALHLGKEWRRIVSAMEKLDGPVAIRAAYNSSESPRSSSAWDAESCRATLINGRAQYTQGYSYASLVPNAHKRGWMMRAALRVVLTHGTFRVDAITATSEAVLEGVTNQEAV